MKIFDNSLIELKSYLDNQSDKVTIFNYDEDNNWEKDGKNNIVLECDTAIELGHPSTESVSFLLWTEKREQINDGRVTVIGKDLSSIQEGKNPFGKIVLVSGHGFNEENAYDRYLEMDMIRHKMNLKGYMIRAVPQKMREWSRISKTALKRGFSFKVLGSETIKRYKRLEYVDGVEVIFITSGIEDLKNIKPLGEKITKSIQAMNKMFENLQYDCKACEFNDICDEMGELRQMHKKMQKNVP